MLPDRNKHARSGYLLIEVLVALTILGVLVASAMPTIGFLLKRTRKARNDIQAQHVLQEGVEIAYAVLTNDWSSVPPGTYVAAVDTTGTIPHWTLFPGGDDTIQSSYTRVLEIREINRNETTGTIGPGPVDPNSRRINSSVSWTEGGKKKELSASLLVVNYER